MNVILDDKQLLRLFPLFIEFDKCFNITKISPAFSSYISKTLIGTGVFDLFEFSGDHAISPLHENFAELRHVKLLVRSTGESLEGEVLAFDTGFILVIRLRPDQYLSLNSELEISNFATDDPIVHGILLFSLQRALLEEQKQVATELVNERQKSVDLLNRINRVAGYISHDFNNFLSIIRLNCDRMAREDGVTTRSLRLIDIIKETASRGSTITRSFMGLLHQPDDSRVPVNIDRLISENRNFFSTVLGGKIEIQYFLGCPDYNTMISPVSALNCIINLLINARDAMPSGGIVRISTDIKTAKLNINNIGKYNDSNGDELSNFIAIEVDDSGVGMDKDSLSRAFEPLFSTKANGNGLGLASVLEFTRDAGGDACIESRPGLGTRVYLYLPVLQASFGVAGEHQSVDRDLSGSPRENESRKILLVDDEPYALEALAELLEMDGYKVDPCDSSGAAVNLLSKNNYDILITDIIMPEMSGIELSKIAKSISNEIKIILMSGFVPSGEIIEYDWNFIRKPISLVILNEIIESCMN